MKTQIIIKPISLSEIKKKLSVEQKKIVDNEKKYYRIVMALKKARKKLKLTQAALAKKANVPRTTITKIESGTRNFTISTLMNLASAINKKVDIRFY